MAKKTSKLSLPTLVRTARAHALLLVGRENARFVTLGWKEKQGQLTNQISIKIYVTEKLSPDELDSYNMFPKEVQAIARGGKPLKATIPIDVVSIGKVKFILLGLKGGEQFYIQSVDVNGTCAILDNNGFIYTNAHIAAEPGIDSTGSSVNVIYNGTSYNGNIYKMSSFQHTGNRMDAAVIELVGFDPNDFWLISGCGVISDPIVNLSDGGTFEYFSGSDHVTLTMPEPTTHPISFHLLQNNEYYGFDGFYHLHVDANSRDQPQPGHSGSLLIKKVGDMWHPAGLVFGLAESASRPLVCVYAWNDVKTWVGN